MRVVDGNLGPLSRSADMIFGRLRAVPDGRASMDASAVSSDVRSVVCWHVRGTIDPRGGGWVRWRALRRVRWRAIAMTGFEAWTCPPALPRWFGPRASPDDPAVWALIARVACGARWADIGGGFNLNVRIDAEPPVVLRVHRALGPPRAGRGTAAPAGAARADAGPRRPAGSDGRPRPAEGR